MEVWWGLLYLPKVCKLQSEHRVGRKDIGNPSSMGLRKLDRSKHVEVDY